MALTSRVVTAVDSPEEPVGSPTERARPLTWFDRIPLITLGLVSFFWFQWWSRHLLYRHNRFGSFGFDLGIFDQAIWLLANGEHFITLRGLDVFGHHVQPALLLYVPFYWLGAGPNFLNVTMVLAVVLGVVPVYKAARHHLANAWLPVILCVVYLLNFSNQRAMHSTFHGDTMAIAPLLMAYLAMLEKRWRAFFLWLAFAVAWKEDMAIAAAMFGVLAAIRGERRRGLIVVVVGIGYYLFATQVVIPYFTPGGSFYEPFYGHLGDGPTGLVDTAVTNPTEIVRQLDRSDAIGYVRQLAGSFGFVSFLSPIPLITAIPQAMGSLLSNQGTHWGVGRHYTAVPITALTIAMIEGVARFRRRELQVGLSAIALVAAVWTSTAWGLAFYSEEYDRGFWPLTATEHHGRLQALIELPPDDAGISASYNLVTHLSHRSQIYEFPNPWRTQNWAIMDENPVDPALVDWILIDRRTTSPAEQVEVEEIIRQEGWVVVANSADVLAARRPGASAGLAPPDPSQAPLPGSTLPD